MFIGFLLFGLCATRNHSNITKRKLSFNTANHCRVGTVFHTIQLVALLIYALLNVESQEYRQLPKQLDVSRFSKLLQNNQLQVFKWNMIGTFLICSVLMGKNARVSGIVVTEVFVL